MLIIEGPDGTGKTTLANHIVEELGYEYRRYPGLSSTTGPDGVGIIDWWRSQIRENNRKVVYDRCFFVSEVIYQLATHGRDLLTTDQEVMRTGLADLWLRDARWIFCHAPWDVSLNIIRSQQEKLRGVSEHNLEKIHWAYGPWAMMHSLAYQEGFVKRFDFTHQDPYDIVHWLKETD